MVVQTSFVNTHILAREQVTHGLAFLAQMIPCCIQVDKNLLFSAFLNGDKKKKKVRL